MNNEYKPTSNDVDKQYRFIVHFLYYGIIAVCILLALKYAGSVLLPFLIAFLIAAILCKPIDWLSKKGHIKRTWISIVLVILFYFLVGIAITLCGAQVLSVLKSFFMGIPEFFTSTITPFLEEVFHWFENVCSSIEPATLALIEEGATGLLQSMGEAVTTLSAGAITAISTVAAGIPGIFVKTIITIIATVFMTIDYHTVTEFISRQIPDKAQKLISEGKSHISGTLLKFVKSYIIIIFITFGELWLGLSVLGIPSAMAIAAIIAIIDILPVLGTGSILIPWAIISGVLGNIKLAVGMSVLYLIITIVRNTIEPKLVGNEVGLHPIVTLASMLLGLHFLGIIGVFAFPIALSLVMNLNSRGIIHIFR